MQTPRLNFFGPHDKVYLSANKSITPRVCKATVQEKAIFHSSHYIRFLVFLCVLLLFIVVATNLWTIYPIYPRAAVLLSHFPQLFFITNVHTK